MMPSFNIMHASHPMPYNMFYLLPFRHLATNKGVEQHCVRMHAYLIQWYTSTHTISLTSPLIVDALSSPTITDNDRPIARWRRYRQHIPVYLCTSKIQLGVLVISIYVCMPLYYYNRYIMFMLKNLATAFHLVRFVICETIFCQQALHARGLIRKTISTALSTIQYSIPYTISTAIPTSTCPPPPRINNPAISLLLRRDAPNNNLCNKYQLTTHYKHTIHHV